MLSIAGRSVRLPEGISRREWLRVGGLGVGLGLPAYYRGRAEAGENHEAGFGRAKSCIILFMFGAPAHQDIWDMKPDAPSPVRGEFKPIASNVPGLFVGEHIPKLATRARKYALIRSVTHPDDTHTVAMHYMLTGVRHARPATNPQNAPDDFPCFGAVVNRLRPTNGSASLPSAISLNAPANQVSANNHIFPGFFAGLLGSGRDPLFVPTNANAGNISPLPSVDKRVGPRLGGRRRLLAEIEASVKSMDSGRASLDLDAHYRRAYDLLSTPAAREAFDLSKESEATRAEYGDTPFGQGCLLSRRLVEAGVPLVTVNWERDDAYWDTHKNNFSDLKDKLLPNMDRGYSALLDDLERRGLLQDTLVVWLAEFGRTPKINTAAGRDHWARCNSVLLAGAGVPGGQVYGASDRIAAYPSRDPVYPEDLAATIYHLLGIPPRTELTSVDARPFTLSKGRVLREVIG